MKALVKFLKNKATWGVGLLLFACLGVIRLGSGHSDVPAEAGGISSLLRPNDFREAYVRGIANDLKRNGDSSRYFVKDGQKSLDGGNVFISSRDGAIWIGYTQSPFGPARVLELRSGIWHHEE